MFLYITIAIISLVALMVLHELGHFLVAKKMGVKVEEFGIGIPPKIVSKKIGETLYSLNLLPIGAFVKIYGEEERIKDKRSFSEKSILQRSAIILGGVIAFWIVAFVALTLIAIIGSPTAIDDDFYAPDAQVMIIGVVSESPAAQAGIIPGDIINEARFNDSFSSINRSEDLKKFIAENKGKDLEFSITRGKENLLVSLEALEEDELMGVHFNRMTTQRYPFYTAPFYGIIMTGRMTRLITTSLFDIARRAVLREPMPEEVKFAGPVAIVGEIFVGAIERGLVDYLTIIAIISISLAIFNLLPIPALDGGRFLLLMIEKIKGSPLNPKIEKNAVAISFLILVGLLIFVTIYDIQRLI